MDKEYIVRAEFEKTGHMTAWHKLKSHNRQSKTKVVVPTSFDEMLVRCELKKMVACTAVYKTVEKKQEEGFFLQMVYHLMRKRLWPVLEDYTCLRVLKQIAKYRMHISRDPEGWEPVGKQPRTIVQGLLHYLFGQYRVPAFLWNLFWRTDCPYRFLGVVYLMMGKSAVDLPELPIPLGKRLVHHFLRAPENASLVLAYRWAQVSRAGGGLALYHQVCKSHLRHKTTDENFWASFIRFAATNPEFPIQQFALIADFIAMKRTGVYTIHAYRPVLPRPKAETSFTFAGRSISKLAAMAETSAKELKMLYSIGIRNWSIYLSARTFGYGDWTVEELTTVDELFAEGKKMRHCVGTYFRNGYLRESAIFSIRRDGKPIATIEVDRKNRSVIQARGPCNVWISGEAEAIFEVWVKENGLKC